MKFIRFDIGQSVRDLLVDRGMTQTELAKKIGHNPSWVSHIANKRGASVKTIDDLCKIFGFEDAGKFISYRSK